MHETETSFQKLTRELSDLFGKGKKDDGSWKVFDFINNSGAREEELENVKANMALLKKSKLTIERLLALQGIEVRTIAIELVKYPESMQKKIEDWKEINSKNLIKLPIRT